MNKKDISTIKKGFKVDDLNLRVGETYNAYCKMDGKKVIFEEKNYFDYLSEEVKELVLTNFKKLLTGAIGTKIFELNFEKDELGTSKQKLLLSVLKSGDKFEDKAKEIIKDILQAHTYETDILVSIIKAECSIEVCNGESQQAEEGKDDTTYGFSFLMCSINKIEPSKKALKYDFKEKELKAESSLNLTVNLNNPIEGFMYPTITDGYVSNDKILYYTSKANQINEPVVTGVLNCQMVATTKEEKELFSDILRASLGERVKPSLMSEIFEKVAQHSLDNETSIITSDEIIAVLNDVGVEDTSKIKDLIEDVRGMQCVDLDVHSIVPNSGKSVKINSSLIDISMSPEVLKNIKQINKNGKKCLIIELDDRVTLEGFDLENEK